MLRTATVLALVLATAGCVTGMEPRRQPQAEPNDFKLGDVLKDILKGQQEKPGQHQPAGRGGAKAAKCTSRDGAVTCACFSKCVRSATDCHCADERPVSPSTTLPPSEPDARP